MNAIDISCKIHILISLMSFASQQEMNSTEQMRARAFFAQLNDDNDDNLSDDSDKITVRLPPEGHGKRTVLTSLLAPYSYTYMTVIRSLDNLLNYGLMESEFVRLCIQEVTKQIENGRCKYGKFGNRKLFDDMI